jgi:hypothetical protein
LKRRYVLTFFQKLPSRLIGMEACASSHQEGTSRPGSGSPSKQNAIERHWRAKKNLSRSPPLPSNSALLRKADLCDRRWADDEPCEPAEVLRDCRQCELELSASWPAQAQTTEPKSMID